jgi:signal recognition particle GTPase
MVHHKIMGALLGPGYDIFVFVAERIHTAYNGGVSTSEEAVVIVKENQNKKQKSKNFLSSLFNKRKKKRKYQVEYECKSSVQLPGIINDKSHVTILAGRKGSGKTFLLVKLLKSCWKDVYDHIIIVSPTFKQQEIWKTISKKGVTLYEDFDEDVLGKIEEQMRGYAHPLLITDDIGEELSKVSPRKINKLVSNSRHGPYSIICLHQKLTQSPTIIREQTDTYIMFGSNSRRERDALFNEMSTMEPREFHNMIQHHTKDEYAFIIATSKKGQIKFYDSNHSVITHSFENETEPQKKKRKA